MLFSRKFQTHCNHLKEVSEKSNMTFQHASGIICGGKMIATGYNTNIRSRIGKTNVPSIHSEGMAIDNYLKRFDKKGRREKYCYIL
jgi:hypothetical protein